MRKFNLKAHKKAKGLEEMFTVPHDTEGLEFLRLARKYLRNGDYQLKARGRNPERKKVAQEAGIRLNFTRDCPLPYASRFALYIKRKTYKKNTGYSFLPTTG